MFGRAPRTKDTLPNFCENMDPDKWGHNSVVSGHLKSTGILRVDGLSTGPSDLGCHKTWCPQNGDSTGDRFRGSSLNTS